MTAKNGTSQGWLFRGSEMLWKCKQSANKGKVQTKDMRSFWKAEMVLQYSHPTHSEPSDRLQLKLNGFPPGTTNFVLQNRLARSTKHNLDSLCPSITNARNLTDVLSTSAVTAALSPPLCHRAPNDSCNPPATTVAATLPLRISDTSTILPVAFTCSTRSLIEVCGLSSGKATIPAATGFKSM